MLYICILIGLLVASLKNILTGHTQRLVDQTYRNKHVALNLCRLYELEIVVGADQSTAQKIFDIQQGGTSQLDISFSFLGGILK